MDNKARWDAAVELFGSLEVGDEFIADRHGMRRLYVVREIGWRFNDRKVKADSLYNDESVEFDCGMFVVRNGQPAPATEPEKSEAEKLISSLKKGAVFWTQCGDSVVKWTVLSSDGNTWIKAENQYPDNGIYMWTVECLNKHNATATRPKTEREVELGDEVAALSAIDARTLINLKAVKKRVQELEASVSEWKARGDSLLKESAGRWDRMVAAETRVKELVDEKSQTEQSFTDYVEGAIKDSELQRKAFDIGARRNKKQGDTIRDAQNRVSELEKKLEVLQESLDDSGKVHRCATAKIIQAGSRVKELESERKEMRVGIFNAERELRSVLK